MAGGHASNDVSLGQARVRRACLAALILLVVQYGLGIILNLYVAITPDSHSGIVHEIASGPLALTAHALLGLGLIGNSLLLLARALRLGDRLVVGLVTGALGSLAGAFAGGEVFVRSGASGASLAMALLTGVALLCYVAVLTQVSATRRDGRHSLHSRGSAHRAGEIRYETYENIDVAAPWSEGGSWSDDESWSEAVPWADAEPPAEPLPRSTPPAAWPTPRRPRISSSLFED